MADATTKRRLKGVAVAARTVQLRGTGRPPATVPFESFTIKKLIDQWCVFCIGTDRVWNPATLFGDLHRRIETSKDFAIELRVRLPGLSCYDISVANSLLG
jgi:hypothetical protein